MEKAPSGTSRTAGRRRTAATILVLDYANLGLTILKGIVLVPLYLRSFNLEVYGAWLAWSNILVIVGALEGGIGLLAGERLARAHGSGDRATLAATAGDGLVLIAFAAIGIAALGSIASPFVAAALTDGRGGARLAPAFLAASAGAGISVVQSSIQTALRSLQQAWAQGVIRTIGMTVDVAVTILCLVAGMGVVALGIGTLAGAAVGALAGMVVLLSRWRALRLPRPTSSRAGAQSLAALTTPLFGSRLAGTVLSNGETALVAFFVGPAAAAVLGLTDRAFKVGLQLINPVASAAFPGLAHLSGDSDGVRLREVIREIIQVFTAVAAVILPAAIALNPSFVRLWVGEERFGGSGLSVLLGVAAFMVARMNLLWWLLAALGRVTRTIWANVLEMVLRLALMALLVLKMGLIGVPLAVIASTLAVSFWYYSRLLAERLDLNGETLTLQVRDGAGAALAFACGLVAARVLPPAANWLTLGFHGLIMVAVLLPTVAVSMPAVSRAFIGSHQA